LFNGKKYIAACLAIFLLLNPLAVFASATTTPHAVEAGKSGDNIFQKTSSFLGLMLAGQNADLDQDLQNDLEQMEAQGLFDPLINTLTGYLGRLMADERTSEVLSKTVIRIYEEEELVELTPREFVVRILRDEELARIIGAVIADQIKNEEFLAFVEQLTSDISALLKDRQFVQFLNNLILDLLNDPSVNNVVFEILGMVKSYQQQIMNKIEDPAVQQVIQGVLDDLLVIFVDPFLAALENMKKDPRWESIQENLLQNVEALKLAISENLSKDEAYQQALENFKARLAIPLETIKNHVQGNLSNNPDFSMLVDEIKAAYENKEILPSLQIFLENLNDKLVRIIGGTDSQGNVIVGEIDRVLNYYEYWKMNLQEGSSPIPGATINQKEVEDQVSAVVNKWAEVIPWVLGQMGDDMNAVINKYLGEEAGYLDAITGAMDAAVASALEELKADLEAILNDHLFDSEEFVQAFLDKNEAKLNAILESILAETEPVKKLIDEKTKILVDVFTEHLEKALRGEGTEKDYDLIGALLSAGPGDRLADLIPRSQVTQLVDNLFQLVDTLPLETLAPYLRANADEIGFTIASTMLNMVADGIEDPTPPEEPDPRIEAILQALKTEERMQQLYLDLGGSNPELIEGVTDEVTVILQVVSEIVQKDQRVDRFLSDLQKEGEPVKNKLLDYGRRIGTAIKEALKRLFAPLIRKFHASFGFGSPSREDQGHLTSWLDPEEFKTEMLKISSLISELLAEHSIPAFISRVIPAFLIDYDTVKEVASPDFFSPVYLFYAEMSDVDDVKKVVGENFTDDLTEALENQLPESIQLDPQELMNAINEMLAGVLPGKALHISAGDVAGDLLEGVADSLEEISKDPDGFVEPVLPLLGAILQDPRTEKAIDDIVKGVATTASTIGSDLFSDTRVKEIMIDFTRELLTEVFVSGQKILRDQRLRQALEDAITAILSDRDMREAIGTLLHDLLGDNDLKLLLQHALHQGRMMTVGYYDPSPEGDSKYVEYNQGYAYPREQYPEVYEELQIPYQFQDAIVIVDIAGFELIDLDVTAEYVQEGCNNGLYAFIEEFLVWWENGVEPYNTPPKAFFSNYLKDFLEEETVREEIVEPLVGILLNTAGDIFSDGLGRALQENLVNIIEGRLLTSLAGNQQAPGLIVEITTELFENLGQILGSRDFEELLGTLLGGALERLPLLPLSHYILKDSKVKGIIGDTGVDINLNSIRPLLTLHPETVNRVVDRVVNFPNMALSGFFEEQERAYNLGYTISDLQARFMVHLLARPELPQVTSELVNEKVAEADYTFAESIFRTISRFTGNESFVRALGDKVYQSLAWVYDSIRGLFLGKKAAPQQSQYQEIEEEVAAAMEQLGEAGAPILEDPRLTEVLEQITWEMVNDETFKKGFQDKKTFVAGILRDERLVQTLGDVIADFLKDERLTQDIEYITAVLFDLLSVPDLHLYLTEILATTIEDPHLERTINRLITAALNLGYTSLTSAVSELVTDERLPELLKEVLAISVESTPGLVAGLLDDLALSQSLQNIAQDLGRYGREELLAKHLTDFYDLAVEIVLTVLEDGFEDLAKLIVEVMEQILPALADGLGDDSLKQWLGDQVDRFLKLEGDPESGPVDLQSYMQDSFAIVKERLHQKVEQITDQDTPITQANIRLFGQRLQLLRWLAFLIVDEESGTGMMNIRRQIGQGIGEIPAELVKEAVFTWLVDGVAEFPAYDPTNPDQKGPYEFRTFRLWAEDLAGIFAEDSFQDLARGGLVNDLRVVLRDYFSANKEMIIGAIEKACTSLPAGNVSSGIKNDQEMKAALETIIARLLENLPLNELADSIRADAKLSQNLKGMVNDLVDALLFRELGSFLKKDQRLLKAAQEIVPDFSLRKVAQVLREEQALLPAIAEAVAEFPVERVTSFLQDETRADLVGHTLASTLLNLLADLVEDEALTDYLLEVLYDFLGVPGEPTGIHNEELGEYLEEKVVPEIKVEVKRETHNLYKVVVPKFFTKFIWSPK